METISRSRAIQVGGGRSMPEGGRRVDLCVPKDIKYCPGPGYECMRLAKIRENVVTALVS